mmetsp:Transcript_82681/g.229443  ORF Transcript_82681/g.229443 Transcript_82681/m.229443 type:complete len:208 (-) Transcript_82681:1356-1979(-)
MIGTLDGAAQRHHGGTERRPGRARCWHRPSRWRAWPQRPLRPRRPGARQWTRGTRQMRWALSQAPAWAPARAAVAAAAAPPPSSRRWRTAAQQTGMAARSFIGAAGPCGASARCPMRRWMWARWWTSYGGDQTATVGRPARGLGSPCHKMMVGSDYLGWSSMPTQRPSWKLPAGSVPGMDASSRRSTLSSTTGAWLRAGTASGAKGC